MCLILIRSLKRATSVCASGIWETPWNAFGRIFRVPQKLGNHCPSPNSFLYLQQISLSKDVSVLFFKMGLSRSVGIFVMHLRNSQEFSGIMVPTIRI